MINKSYAKDVLEMFLNLPINSSKPVLDKFSELPGAVSYNDGEKRAFVYVPGTREDRIVLIAHADTVWDKEYTSRAAPTQEVEYIDGSFKSKNDICGIGADDRAGCALLWLLRECGHSLLVLDGEEHGQIASNYIKRSLPNLYDELNEHSYMIDLDRRGYNDYKVYQIPVSKDFIRFIEQETGYVDAGTRSYTDIVALCRDVCGVNLSVGYYNEHYSDEILVFDEWYNTLSIVEKMISERQNKYPTVKSADRQSILSGLIGR